MFIRVGTLCLLLSPHSLAGRTCVVSGSLEYAHELTHYVTGANNPKFAYPIEVSCSPVQGAHWYAAPSQLVPITPPRPVACEDARKPEDVAT